MASAKRSLKKTDPFLLVRMMERARSGTALASKWRASGRVLGVDLAPRKTGLLILTDQGIYMHSRTLTYALARTHKSDPPISEAQRIERMLAIANEIIGVCKTYKIAHVGIEGYAMDARFQAHQIGEVAGVVKTQLYLALRMIPTIVAPNVGRKHVLGYGRPDKAQIVKVVRDGLGYPVQSDHEADAGVVARYTFDQKVLEHQQQEAT